jgi:UrcA family protein
MNAKTKLSQPCGPHIGVRSVALMTLLILAPLAVMAQQPQATDRPRARAADLSLVGLDLSTSTGVDAARDRLHQIARRECFQLADSRELSRTQRASFTACVDDTLAAALQQIDGRRRAVIEGPGEWHAEPTELTQVRSPPTTLKTRVMVVSLVNLDLSTPTGVHIAQDRIRGAARRVCRQTSGSEDPAEMLHYAHCVDDATAGALRQIRSPALAAVDHPAAQSASAP